MLSTGALAIDAESLTQRICEWLRSTILGTLRRRGAVIGISGGVDSAVCTALAARALGADKVFGLLLPERDSASASLRLGRAVAEAFGVPAHVEPIGPALAAIGCYERQAEAIREVFPEYGDGYKCKLVVPPVGDTGQLNVVQLVIETPAHEVKTSRMPAEAYRKIVAATNYKQRLRKTTEYYHADRLGYAVIGTPNRLEYALGFFVKQGDGAADVKPIAHLYKTQVYALAEHLGVPDEVRRAPPTTDTFSMPQTQEEFYFALPYDKMDLCLFGKDRDLDASEIARATELSLAQVERVYRDIDAKRRFAKYLHAPPLVCEPLEH
jgi:NAD+ synthase